MKLLRRSTPLAPTLCLMKMLRIWRPTSSSDPMSYVLCGCRTDDHTSWIPPQAVEWDYNAEIDGTEVSLCFLDLRCWAPVDVRLLENGGFSESSAHLRFAERNSWNFWPPGHSPLMFAPFTIGHHFATSALCQAPNASGVCWSRGGISRPRSSNRL